VKIERDLMHYCQARVGRVQPSDDPTWSRVCLARRRLRKLSVAADCRDRRRRERDSAEPRERSAEKNGRAKVKRKVRPGSGLGRGRITLEVRELVHSAFKLAGWDKHDSLGHEIRKHLGKQIVIDPYDEANLNPNSYNLTLHNS